ncbi:MAG: glycoside hydrolase family 2 TIM barrel-domain containing protein, partial [Kiritimatiellales bacterium]
AESHIRDFTVVTDLDDQYKDATLNVDCELIGEGAVEADLYDAAGKKVLSSPQKKIANPEKWTAETPTLYTLLLTLRDASGHIVEVIPQRVGFREVEIINSRLCVNGVPILIKGTNRHEHDPDTGHTISREAMIRDIQLLKENNFNAVRTCHYPNMPMWYELCDEYGIYLWDEANIESHGMGYGPESLAKQPDWTAAHLDRLQRMVGRDKNHASVVVWSMGNEAGDGENFTAGYQWIKASDPTRPVHYERSADQNTDIVNRMYASPEKIRKYVEDDPKKPYIICEYEHAMGNSNGNLREYWDIFDEDNPAQGGFVWDWMDQGIRQHVPSSYWKTVGSGPVEKSFFAYGGWWETTAGVHHNGSFCMNGLLNAAQEPHPGLYALKYIQRNVQVKSVDLASGTVTIRNRFDFSRLDEKVSGHWKLEADGELIAEGDVPDLKIPSRQERAVSLDLPSINPSDGREYFLTLSFTAIKGYHPLVKAGTELAWDQFPLNSPGISKVLPASSAPLSLAEDDAAVMLSGADFSVSFSKGSGALVSFTAGGKELIAGGGHLDFWRALTDNDRPQMRPKKVEKRQIRKVWQTAGPTAQMKGLSIERMDESTVRVSTDFGLPDVDGTSRIVYTVHGDGTMDVDVSCDFSRTPAVLKYPLRVGMEWTASAGLEQVRWFGRGPNPTYSDRNFERVGKYSSTVDGLWVDYSRPQENGNNTDVRWMSLTDKDGRGLMVSAVGDPLSIGARHYGRETMENAAYSFEMERSANIFLNIDAAQSGVGGINSWGAAPLDPYRLKDKTWRYSYRIQPVNQDSIP